MSLFVGIPTRVENTVDSVDPRCVQEVAQAILDAGFLDQWNRNGINHKFKITVHGMGIVTFNSEWIRKANAVTYPRIPLKLSFIIHWAEHEFGGIPFKSETGKVEYDGTSPTAHNVNSLNFLFLKEQAKELKKRVPLSKRKLTVNAAREPDVTQLVHDQLDVWPFLLDFNTSASNPVQIAVNNWHSFAEEANESRRRNDILTVDERVG